MCYLTANGLTRALDQWSEYSKALACPITTANARFVNHWRSTALGMCPPQHETCDSKKMCAQAAIARHFGAWIRMSVLVWVFPCRYHMYERKSCPFSSTHSTSYALVWPRLLCDVVQYLFLFWLSVCSELSLLYYCWTSNKSDITSSSASNQSI